MKLLIALFATVAWSQSVVVNNIAPSSQQYYSYAVQAPPTPPVGTQFLLNFPNQALGGQLTPPACSTYSALQYNHFTYDAGTATWSGPVTGPVYGFFTTFYESKTPSAGWAGIRANVAFDGVLGSNNSPSTQTFIQSVYMSTDQCYEFGPEFGFYRLLQNPGNTTEQNTVFFYYGVNVNCFNVGPLGSCRDKTTGQSLIYNATTHGLTIPAANSRGGKNFIYSAYLTSISNWRVSVLDPYTNLDVISPQNFSVDSYFTSTASVMITGGLTGYITSTQQRNSVLGGITDSMSSPLKTTVYALAQIALAFSPTVLAGRPAYNGACLLGGQTIYAPAVAGGAPGIKNYGHVGTGINCTITVFNAGTTTPATLFNSSGGGMANPFNANNFGMFQFYADNGSYDVRISSAAGTYTMGGINMFDITSYVPVDLWATHSIGVYGASGSSFKEGFIGNTITQNLFWTLPASDSAGCLASDGSLNLSFRSCTPGGATTNVQYNNAGAFAGDANFTWTPASQVLTLTGIGGTPGLRVNNGFVQSGGGFLSAVNSWQGFNTATDGALLRGLHITETGVTGGYINIANLTYGTQPAPLNGLSLFGPHTALLWVSATNQMSADVTYGLNTNLFVNAAGGFAVCTASGLSCADAPFNSFQSPNGGMFAKSFTAAKYIQTGTNNGVPTLTTSDSFNPGALYWDTGLNELRVFNGSAWNAVGSGGGGGGTPGGPSTAVQFNNAGLFGGSANFYWNNASRQLVITSAAANNAGIVNLVGFIQAENGFLAQVAAAPSTALNYNVIQAPTGGMAARSFTSSKYIQTGTSNGIPAVTTADTFNAGALYWDTGSAGLKVYNGSAWVAVATGGATSPGGSNTSVQYNSSGSFGGDSFFFYNHATQLLTVTALNSSSAGIAIATGFAQADQGFIATSGTANNYNVIQAPTGGVAARSVTASKYIQAGNNNGIPTVTAADTFNAGALYWDTGATALKVFNGSSWITVATGGATTPGGANTNVQYNASGSFGGSANFTFNPATQLLTVTALNSSSAGIAVGTGFIQSDRGFIATTGVATQYNAVQAPTGGMAARSFTATTYVQAGNGTVDPTVTTSDTFNAGAMYYNTVSSCVKVYNGSTWGCISSGGTPGGANTQVQFNNSGAFGGSANFTWTNASQLLNVVGIASTAGINVQTGFIQSDGGFVVNTSTAYNSIHTTATGGMAGRSYTATKYLQMGNNSGAPTATTSDTFNAGAIYWDTVATLPKVFDSSTWKNIYIDGSNASYASVTTTGVVQSGATGASISFQNTNFNFQVSGAGDVSAAGSMNLTGVGTSLYKMNGNAVISSFLGGTFIGPGGISVPSGGTLTVASGATIAFNTTIGRYNNIQTAGVGAPAIYYSNIVASASGNVGTTQITIGGSNPPAGMYRVSLFLIPLYTGTTGTGTVTLSILRAVGGAQVGADIYSTGATAHCLNNDTFQPSVVYTDGSSSGLGYSGLAFGINSTLTGCNYSYGIIVEKLN